MGRHKAVHESDGNENSHWIIELKLLIEYGAYCIEFVKMLAQIEYMLDGPFKSIKAVQHQLELKKLKFRPIHSALF